MVDKEGLSFCTMRHIPPLPAVRAFEAAARHENFTRAAAELGMTQAAVSYQIRLLEERLGVPLFRREKKKVVLTETGRRAAIEVSRAFDALDAAFSVVRAEDQGTSRRPTPSPTPGSPGGWARSR